MADNTQYPNICGDIQAELDRYPDLPRMTLSRGTVEHLLKLAALLVEANEVLRSTHQIAVQKRVDTALLGQHAVMYPKES
jgi:hypothetical protein